MVAIANPQIKGVVREAAGRFAASAALPTILLPIDPPSVLLENSGGPDTTRTCDLRLRRAFPGVCGGLLGFAGLA